MIKLGKTTAELILAAYEDDLSGLLALFTHFAQGGLSWIAQAVKFNFHHIITLIEEKYPTIAKPLSGRQSS
jgi:hypothetical protein